MRIARAAAVLAIAMLAGCATPQTQPAASQELVAGADAVRLNVQISPHGIAWAELGTGSPLLLLNGTASPMSEWDPAFLASLSQRARVIVFDYPGLGQSTAPAQRTFPAMADTVSQLLVDTRVDDADLLGWSMGGFVAQEMLRSHRDQVHRAVLMGTNPGGRRTELGPPWVQRADSDAHAGLRTYLRTNYPHTRCAQRAGHRFLKRLAAAQNSGRFPASRVPAATNRAMVDAEDPWLRSNRNLRELASVTTPTLVVVGTRDVITPPANSRILSGAIPGAELMRVPASGHSVGFQAPSAVAAAIGAFLAGQPVRQVLRTACS